MITKISVIPGSLAEEIFFFSEADLTKLPDPRIVPLFGPNGIGKTTIIKNILSAFNLQKVRQKLMNEDGSFSEQFFKKESLRAGIAIEMDSQQTEIYSYSNSSDNFRIREARNCYEVYDPHFLSDRLNAKRISEGQSIIYSAFALLDGLIPGKNMFGSLESCCVALLDEIDSGLSVDNIDLAMRKLKKALKNRENLQVFLSFNSPRVLKYFPYVLSMYDGKVCEMHTDEDMLAEIRKNKKMFDKARKNSRGMPKIYD